MNWADCELRPPWWFRACWWVLVRLLGERFVIEGFLRGVFRPESVRGFANNGILHNLLKFEDQLKKRLEAIS